MNTIFGLAERIAAPFLRLSMAVILLWIGALKFVDPSPVVGLLQASFPFLASNAIVYALGVAEIVVAGMLLIGYGVRYAGLVMIGLFAGTLGVFLVAPAVTYGSAGFPLLSLAGQFLLKDLALMAVSVNLIAMDAARQPARASMRPASVPAV